MSHKTKKKRGYTFIMEMDINLLKNKAWTLLIIF